MKADDVVALLPREVTAADLRAGLMELCRRGLLTCTRGQPGDTGATYALAWLPLDDADHYPESVRLRHTANMRALRGAT